MSFALPADGTAPHGNSPTPGVENELQAEMRRIIEGVYGPPVRQLPGLDIGRAYLGAVDGFRFGGDMVDVFHFGSGSTSLAVVDISGHGIRAAANAGLAKYALRAYASRGLDARDCVRALNRLCIESSAFEGEEDFFATVFFAIVQPDRRAMQYVSAGHEAAFLIEPHTAKILAATGPIVGLMDADALFDQGIVRLPAASIVAAVTDGFTEARNAEREFLGPDALVDIIDRNRASEAERQAEALTHYAYQFANEHLHDDIAALVVKLAS
jgi:serine phosphatase RsbU (regulator of sigma subunit)